ncbi:DUF4328 domain-containing protein [Altererythrobacter sp. KTW20L]|uniref:DUF4328 domain-containing protein n=1 Tax=Altererythrobacter sp. KTW20L TaxID=2942210 RepID=UPI0020BD4A7C|nr:DUF4328 domain-containing protein [Altererythrobacter sp. KTW20L]MCL6250713.1 DUF4328 domain-containing protein [Altererythrobacter sp. KTW20L]
MTVTIRGAARLETRAKVCRLALWTFIVVCALTFCLLLVVMARQLQLAYPPPQILALYGLGELLLWLVLLLGTIPVSLWLYRAHANLHEGSVGGLNYSPGWAVGSFFVPVANLFVPMKAMRDLHNRSNGEPADFAASSVGDVTSWWACHLAAVLLAFIVVVIALVPLITNAYWTTPPAATSVLGLLNILFWTGSAAYLLRIINAVTTAQAHGVSSAAVFE